MKTALHDDTDRAFNLQLFADGEPAAATAGGAGTSEPSAADGTLLTGTTPGQGEQPQGEQPGGEKPTEGDKAEGDEPQGAPEEYTDFELPEGMTWDAERSADFVGAMKECGLTQEQAQKVIGIGAKMMGEQAQMIDAQAKEISQGWLNEAKEKFNQADIDLANKTLGQYADKGFVDFLSQSGLGNHPQMIGFMTKIGKMVSEGSFIEGGNADKPRSLADRMFGK